MDGDCGLSRVFENIYFGWNSGIYVILYVSYIVREYAFYRYTVYVSFVGGESVSTPWLLIYLIRIYVLILFAVRTNVIYAAFLTSV